jgi:hypothetical protein
MELIFVHSLCVFSVHNILRVFLLLSSVRCLVIILLLVSFLCVCVCVYIYIYIYMFMVELQLNLKPSEY